jgi:hypothetical protein
MVRTSRYLAVACLIAAGLAGCSRSSSPAPEPIGGPTMRLSAASVQGSAGIDLSAATDRDTTTGTTVSGPLDVVLRFDHAVEIRAVKARGDGVSIAVRARASSSSPAAGGRSGSPRRSWPRS